MTLLPYLHSLELKEEEKKRIHYFAEPYPAREINYIEQVCQVLFTFVWIIRK